VASGGGGSGFGGVSPRRTTAKTFKFKKPRVSMAMKVTAPRI
jgi:hypothetical protein